MPSKTQLIGIEFSLEWKSHAATHTDIYHVSSVDLSKDILPPSFIDKLPTLKQGESYSERLQPKDLLGEGHTSNKVIRFAANLFNTQFKNRNSPALLYRFYPCAIAWQGLDTKESDYTPFRLISINDELVADCNHPLSKYFVDLKATKIKKSAHNKETTPRRNVIKMITSRGPGMQAPFEFGEPVFFDQYPLNINERNSLATQQLDKTAEKEIANLYSSHLSKHSKVLDLMSTINSYLSDDFQTGLLAGLGNDESELEANPRLNTYEIQDLNKDTKLPYENNSFDDAICTLSIQSLIEPLAIMKEVARVVSSGGKFIITFSNHNLSNQVTDLWVQLHPFERMQLVLEYFRDSGLFTNLHTYSKRGLPRPADDQYIDQKPISDPIFAVWGIVK